MKKISDNNKGNQNGIILSMAVTSSINISILNEMQISKKHCSSRLHVKFQVLRNSFSIDKATGRCDPGQREQTQTEVSGYNGFNTCDGRSFCVNNNLRPPKQS